LDKIDYIEIIRAQLNKAIELNSSKEHIIEISELLDIEIVKYLEKKEKSE
jgi:hypothetical protein